jgi:hypothetical protein
MAIPTRRWSGLAGALLALALVTPASNAATPSPTDPRDSVDALLETIVAKDFAAIPPLICAEHRDAATARFDLAQAFASLPDTVDVAALIEALDVSSQDVTMEIVSNDGTTAQVAVTGSLVIEVDAEAARRFAAQLLEAQGEEVTEALLDQVTPLVVDQLETPQDLSKTLPVVLEDGAWLVCDAFRDEDASPSPSVSPSPSASAGPSLPPMDPAAYERLLAAIPEGLRDTCEPDAYWQVEGLGPEPGEIASADCDPDTASGGNFIAYSLYESASAMDADYDTQLTGMRALGGLEGPGCPTGPGEGIWEHGRRFCYTFATNDANMRWTDERALIAGNMINDDGDWAALETFFAEAQPVEG